jgi:hypothetical protein
MTKSDQNIFLDDWIQFGLAEFRIFSHFLAFFKHEPKDVSKPQLTAPYGTQRELTGPEKTTTIRADS